MNSKEERQEQISRRKFLRGAAAGAGVVAGSYPLFAGAQTSECACALPGVPETWDEETEVLVIGTGFAGQAAALEAEAAGAQVLMIEKAPEAEQGGNSRVCGQGFIAPSEAIWDDYFEYLKMATAGQGFPVPDEHLRFYIEESHKNIEWFEKMGATVITDVESNPTRSLGSWIPFFPHFPGADAVASEPGYYTLGGDYFGAGRNWYFLEDQIKQRKNIRKLFETPAKKLIQHPETKEILGVVAEQDGKEINIKATKAVVVCAGGWEYNQQMVRDFQGIAANYSPGSPYNTGETIKMCWAAGADIRNMSVRAAPVGLSAGVLPGFKGSIGVFQTQKEGGSITIGANNKRWRDEHRTFVFGIQNKEKAVQEGAAVYSGQIIENGVYVRDPHPMPMHIIFDEKARLSGPLFDARWARDIEGYNASPDNSQELEWGWYVKADTIAELAEKIDRDPEALEATIKAWNEACEAGVDEKYGRTKNMEPFADEGPYYAIQVYPRCLNTQGGMTRNTKSQVLDIFGEPIKRLYSAGENGDIWTWLYQCMSNVGAGCYGYGRVAGQNAAAETPWDEA